MDEIVCPKFGGPGEDNPEYQKEHMDRLRRD